MEIKNIFKKYLPTTHYPLPTLLTLFVLVSCGYKPISHYTTTTIHQPLYLEVKLSSKEPDAGVFLKDELYSAIVNRLGVRVTSLQNATSRLRVSYDDIAYTALGYDEAGYVERYRVNMVTSFILKNGDKTVKRKIKTTHEANITPSAIESSRAKQKAIEECTKKAVDQFVAFMAANSVRSEE